MHDPAMILAVDDDPAVLLGTVRLLKGAGHTVLEASSGQECLDMVRSHRPDLVLLDVVLPDIEGPEVCRMIKADPALASVFVVLLSGMRTTPDHQADGLDLGADGYIPRPFSNREFLSRVTSILRIKRAEDDLRDAKEKVERLNAELNETIGRVRKLEGILPICMHCHSIRSDVETWQKLEGYLQEHSDVILSHGLRPECLEKFYPENGEDTDDEYKILRDL
jgi:DNA-binding response OmpR family regulator